MSPFRKQQEHLRHRVPAKAGTHHLPVPYRAYRRWAPAFAGARDLIPKDAAALDSDRESRNRPAQSGDQSFPYGEQVAVSPVDDVAVEKVTGDRQRVEDVFR